MVLTLNTVRFANNTNGPNVESSSRDPNDINKTSQIVWSSIIGEPESYRSPDWVWKISSVCFTFVQTRVYKLLTILLAPILAFILALVFAILAFIKIWFISPLNKFFHVIFSSIKTFLEIVLQGVLSPFCETIGQCLSNLKIKHQRIYEAKDEPQYPFII